MIRLLALLPWYDPEAIEARHEASARTLARAQAARQAKVDVIDRYRRADAAIERLGRH